MLKRSRLAHCPRRGLHVHQYIRPTGVRLTRYTLYWTPLPGAAGQMFERSQNPEALGAVGTVTHARHMMPDQLVGVAAQLLDQSLGAVGRGVATRSSGMADIMVTGSFLHPLIADHFVIGTPRFSAHQSQIDETDSISAQGHISATYKAAQLFELFLPIPFDAPNPLKVGQRQKGTKRRSSPSVCVCTLYSSQ